MPRSKEDQLQYKRFCDLGNMAYQRGFCVYSDFVTIAEQELAYQALETVYPDLHAGQLPLYAYGGYEEADRRVLCFMPTASSDTPSDMQFPISCIRIAPANRRFGEALTHRDYLGTVMGMGLKRDQIGDILVRMEGPEGSTAAVGYVFCKSNMESLLLGLERIRHTTVRTECIPLNQLHWEQKYKDISGSVTTPRLDAVLSVAIRTSRTQGLQLIRDGNIYINGKCCTENAKSLREGDIISVRGHGKYRLYQIGGQSKKGRYHITVQQYI